MWWAHASGAPPPRHPGWPCLIRWSYATRDRFPARSGQGAHDRGTGLMLHSIQTRRQRLRYMIKETTVITTPNQPTTYTARSSSVAARLLAVIRWPFTNKFAAPIWLALRLYIAWIWFQMSMSKFQAGWLTSDPVG